MPASATCRAIILHPLVAPTASAQTEESLAAAKILRAFCPKAPSPKSRRELSLLDFACDEAVHVMLSFLDGASLCSARSVCRSWHRLGADDQLWLKLCLNEFHVSPDQLTTQPESYLKLYQVACRSLKMLLRDYMHEQCLTNLQNSLRIPRAAAMTLIASRSTA